MTLKSLISQQLWESIEKPYVSGIYTSAILDAIHHLSNILREKADVDGDGKSLVGQALGGDSPRLRINKFQTESDRNEQQGFAQILFGLYQGIRNPRSHDHANDSQETADSIIIFINYLLSVIDKAKEPFSLSEWLENISDPHFFTSSEYARLLISEVPPKKFADTLIEIYKNKWRENDEAIKCVFSEMLKLATEAQVNDLMAVVSDELKVVLDDSELRKSLSLLPPDLWKKLSERARLRVENRLVTNIKEGKSKPGSNRTNGWLGTWARDFLTHFTLKEMALDTLIAKLNSDDEEDKEYVAQYFFDVIPSIIDSLDPTSFMDEYYYIVLANICETELKKRSNSSLYIKCKILVKKAPEKLKKHLTEQTNIEPSKDTPTESSSSVDDIPF
jgi:uncharacterized protein (TIGR02391 family)